MNSLEAAIFGLWRHRLRPSRPYLLINDTRGYLEQTPAMLTIDGQKIPIHVCPNEWALRLHTEAERDSGQATPQILISRKQLEPENLPDLQAQSSLLPRTLTACDLAQALGVSKPRPLFDRLPKESFWGLAPYLKHLEQYTLERVILASLLDDPSVLTAGWEPTRVLEKLWYEGVLVRIRRLLSVLEGDERRSLEREFLDVVRTWLDPARFAVVQAAVLEAQPPPVLPLCLLAFILDGWGTLTPAAMRSFLDDCELGDLFVDVLKDGSDLSSLADWGRRITGRADENCANALRYLQVEVFPRKPAALTEALSTVVKAVGGSGTSRLLTQLVRLLEADGGLLAQGLAVTLKALLGVAESGTINGLPLENASFNLADRIDDADSAEWEHLLEALRSHQSREQYEDHVSLLEALVTVHRLTGKAEAAANKLAGLDWKAWLDLVDRVYLPLSAQSTEAQRLAGRVPQSISIHKISERAAKALQGISMSYADFYVDPQRGLPKWLTDRTYAAGTCRPPLNSDIVDLAVKPLLTDSSLQQVYLVVFDGMSVANWLMLRDRFLLPKGRELFRPYQEQPEARAFTYLPSITQLCRAAVFAGVPPVEFSTWPRNRSEPDLLDRCLNDLNCRPKGWDKDKHYLCFNEKDANPDELNRKLRSLVEMPARFKAIVFNLQDRLLDKSGISSIQEIMLAYVREVALPHLRRIAAQKSTALVITSDHGFAPYDMQYPIHDVRFGSHVKIHNRCLEYTHTDRTNVGPKAFKRLDPAAAFGLPLGWEAADVVTARDSYGFPDRDPRARNNPRSSIGHDHGGLTPEETVVPIATFVTR